MSTASAHQRHRAHHTKSPAILAFLFVVTGCGGGSLRRPERVQVRTEDYVAVPSAPRVPPVEVVPPSPNKAAVWVDGTWEWSGSRYGWKSGTWVVVPSGVRYARWVIVRRKEDGQLFFAPSSWRNPGGQIMPEPAPLARARTRTLTPEQAAPGEASGASGASGGE